MQEYKPTDADLRAMLIRSITARDRADFRDLTLTASRPKWTREVHLAVRVTGGAHIRTFTRDLQHVFGTEVAFRRAVAELLTEMRRALYTDAARPSASVA